MTRQDLIRELMNTELTEHKKLTRSQARAAINEIFDAIAGALRNGETIKLPIGRFNIAEHKHKPTRGWFLDRVRVSYRRRKYVQFGAEESDLKPEGEGQNV